MPSDGHNHDHDQNYEPLNPNQTQMQMQTQTKKWISSRWVYLGQGFSQQQQRAVDGLSGSVIWNDDGNVLGFFRYDPTSGHFRDWALMVSADHVIECGYSEPQLFERLFIFVLQCPIMGVRLFEQIRRSRSRSVKMRVTQSPYTAVYRIQYITQTQRDEKERIHESQCPNMRC